MKLSDGQGFPPFLQLLFRPIIQKILLSCTVRSDLFLAYLSCPVGLISYLWRYAYNEPWKMDTREKNVAMMRTSEYARVPDYNSQLDGQC